MSQERLAPQQPAACLIQSRKSTCKGGTLIADDVYTLSEHRRRGTEGYRKWLGGCPKCGHSKLHVHDYRERKALALMLRVVVTVVRFICVNPQCRATWQVLPGFLARHLWWTWRTVEQETATEAQKSAPEPSPAAEPELAAVGTSTERVPSTRTRQRWLVSLRASAAQLVELMKSRAGKRMESVVHALRWNSTRAELLEHYTQVMGVESGRRHAAVAALVHDLERGIRLM